MYIRLLQYIFLLLACTYPNSAISSNKETVTIYIVKNDKEFLSPYGLFSYLIWSQLKKNKNLDNKYKFELKVTNGSVSTLFDIEKNKGSLFVGAVQSDVLYHFINGLHINFPVGRKKSNIRSIARLFDEDIIIQKLAKSEAQSLSGSYIDLGEIGTGTFASAKNVLKYIGANYNECIENKKCDFQFSVKSRKQNQYRFCDGKIASPCELMLDNKKTQIVAGSIPNVYRSKEVENGEIITVQAILIGAAQLPDEVVNQIKSIIGNLRYVREKNSNISNNIVDLTPNITLEEVGGALVHSSTINEFHNHSENKNTSFYMELPVTPHKVISIGNLPPVSRFIVERIPLALFQWGLFLILVIYILINFYSRLRSSGSFLGFSRFEMAESLFQIFKYAAAFILFHCLVAFGIYLGEHHHSNFLQRSDIAKNGIGEAIIWLFYLVFTGSTKSQIYSTSATLWVGVLQGAYVMITALFSFEIGKRIKRIMSKPLQKSVFIVGKSQLQLDVEHELKGIKLASYSISANELWGILCKDEFSGTLDDNLVKCTSRDGKMNEFSIKSIRDSAAAFIVLSDNTQQVMVGVSSPDFTNLKLTEFIMKEMIGEDASTRLTIEVNDPFNVSIFESLAYSNGLVGRFEAICVERFGAELLVQSIKKPFIVDIFEELLKTKDSDNEIYFDDNRELNGKTFLELSHYYRENAASAPSIPIGLIGADGHYVLNPENTTIINTDDEKVILISRSQP